MQQSDLAYRSVFISDVHLGAKGCQAESIRHFLHDIQCENLYLVGDIVDMWVGARPGKWKQEHTNVIRTILGKSQNGCVVRYTPGNHDALVRKLNGSELGNIAINHSFIHTTADGKRLLIVHGDFFDRSVTVLKPLAWVGAWFYEFLTVFNTWVNKIRRLPHPRRATFSARAKKQLKNCIQYFTNFEERITVDAQHQGYDGVVCGHIHKPRIKLRSEGGLYVNCGDWVEHCSAIVEHFDGRLQLVYWADMINSTELETKELEESPSEAKALEAKDVEVKDVEVKEDLDSDLDDSCIILKAV